jgi:hypothetical protein
VKERKKKALEIPKAAIRSGIDSPRTGNLMNSRSEGLRLARVFER